MWTPITNREIIITDGHVLDGWTATITLAGENLGGLDEPEGADSEIIIRIKTGRAFCTPRDIIRMLGKNPHPKPTKNPAPHNPVAIPVHPQRGWMPHRRK